MDDLLYLFGTVAFFAADARVRARCERLGRDGATARRGDPMSAEPWIGGFIAVAVLVYLVYTLLRPEKF